MPANSTPDAWVAMPPAEALEAQRAERPAGYDFGFVPAMGRLLMAHPVIGPSFGGHFMTVMFGPGALGRAERELVAGVAASAQDCFY